MSARRLVVAGVATLVLSAAAVVAPVDMAWSAPALRVAELPVPVARRVAVPFARLAAPLARTVGVPFAASHLGVRWTGTEDAVVEARTSALPGVWGPWQQVEVAHDLGDAARHRVLSGLLRAGGASRVQVRARGNARDLDVVAIDSENGPRHLVRDRPRAAGAAVAQPPVIARSQWGADESMRRTGPSHAPVSRMVVHHTVTPNNDPDPASTMRAMYAYHVKGNGWDDIGYNFVVDGSGRVYEGRHARSYAPGEVPTGESLDGRGVIGAHAEGDNDGSVGVAVMGTFTGTVPPQAAVDAVVRLLAWKADRHGLDPVGTTTWAGGRTLPTVAGHRDVGSTACPGDQLYARLPTIRQAAAAAVAQARGSTTPGYWTVARDGRVFAFGRATAPLGAVLGALVAPAAGVAATRSGQGFWVVSEGGRVLPFGDALLLGSPELSGLLDRPGRSVAIEATPSGLGYWVAEEGGRVRNYGDAPALGGPGTGPVVGMARTPSGRGYWVATADGRVSAHGDAPGLGSAAGRSGAPIVAVAGAEGGRGYWLVAADGTVLPFGAARRAGGLPERRVAARVVDARATATGRGYYLLGADGAVFTFGDAAFHGAPTGLVAGGAAAIAVAG